MMKNAIWARAQGQGGAAWLLLLSPLLLYLAWPKFFLPPEGVYLADYAVRVAMIVVVLAFGGLSLPGPTTETLGRWKRWGIVAAIAVVSVVLALLNAHDFGIDGLSDPPWTYSLFPPPPSEAWGIFDLTVGLVLVAVSEELAFRRVFFGLWQMWGWPALTLISSVVFALVHLPQGVVSVVVAAIIGALFMVAYRMSGTILVPIALHFAYNFLVYTTGPQTPE